MVVFFSLSFLSSSLLPDSESTGRFTFFFFLKNQKNLNFKFYTNCEPFYSKKSKNKTSYTDQYTVESTLFRSRIKDYPYRTTLIILTVAGTEYSCFHQYELKVPDPGGKLIMGPDTDPT
jgi:hypothetical protein